MVGFLNFHNWGIIRNRASGGLRIASPGVNRSLHNNIKNIRGLPLSWRIKDRNNGIKAATIGADMKSQDEGNSDRLLHQALREWKVKDRHLPARFHEQVWRRIERIEAQAHATLWNQVVDSITNSLARPSLALSYVTLLLMAGLLAGYLQARLEKAHTVETLSSRYVQMMDPYQHGSEK